MALLQTDLLFDNEVEDAARVFRGVPSVETVIPVSAAEQRNVSAVEDWAVSHLPPGPALYPKVKSAAFTPPCTYCIAALSIGQHLGEASLLA